MSRIGKKPIEIPKDVQVEFKDRTLIVRGPKGELSITIPNGIEYSYQNQRLTFSRTDDDKKVRAAHGLTRAIVNNMVQGVREGFAKTLQIEGIGYKAEMKGKSLMLTLGYSHPILFIPPDGITIESPNPTTIVVKGIDKQVVGEVAAKIRMLRPPEPYKGKGIRYLGEYARRKPGKSASK